MIPLVAVLFGASCAVAWYSVTRCRGGRRRVSLMIAASALFFCGIFAFGQALRDVGYITAGRSEYAAEIQSDVKSFAVRKGEIITIPLMLSNRGSVRWSSDAKENPFFLSWHILTSGGDMHRYENPRIAFPSPVEPDHGLSVMIPFDAAASNLSPGSYIIEFDVVREGVAWFATRGSATLRIGVVVLDQIDETQPLTEGSMR